MTTAHYQIDDRAFSPLINGSAALDRLVSGCRWAEGPVWFDDLQCLLFSDLPNNRVLALTRHRPPRPFAATPPRRSDPCTPQFQKAT